AAPDRGDGHRRGLHGVLHPRPDHGHDSVGAMRAERTQQPRRNRMRKIIELLKKRWQGRSVPRPDRGMTLLEIMIVLALIGLVMVAIVGGVIPAFNKGKIKTAKLAAEKIAGSVAQYTADNEGKCPTLEELVAGGFLQKSQMKDPWG